jgi:hypothetical protein
MTTKIPMIQKQKFYDAGHKLPKCINPGCNNDVAVRDWSNWSFKTECSRCQSARKKGIMLEGITIHKKSYCENIDGHLGFTCPVPNIESWRGFEIGCLDLDHVDGNHSNNSTDNVRTYCKLCHNRKSIESGDCSNKKESARTFNS